MTELAALTDLLVDLFNQRELMRFLTRDERLSDLADELQESVSRVALATDCADMLIRRGLVGDQLREALRKSRPHRLKDIEACWASLKTAGRMPTPHELTTNWCLEHTVRRKLLSCSMDEAWGYLISEEGPLDLAGFPAGATSRRVYLSRTRTVQTLLCEQTIDLTRIPPLTAVKGLIDSKQLSRFAAGHSLHLMYEDQKRIQWTAESLAFSGRGVIGLEYSAEDLELFCVGRYQIFPHRVKNKLLAGLLQSAVALRIGMLSRWFPEMYEEWADYMVEAVEDYARRSP